MHSIPTCDKGVEVADVVRASVLVVWVAPAWVRTLSAAPTKMDVGMTPCTEGAPTSPKQDVSGRPAHDS